MEKCTSITLNGTQHFMGREIPVVLGGFGPNKRCMSDKTIAEIHGMETKNVRARITENIKRFREDIDYIDLKKVACAASNFTICSQLGYSRMEITKAEHIYILSEFGYSKLVKIMDTDLAWEIHDAIMTEYFELREQESGKSPRKKVKPTDGFTLPAVTAAAKAAIPILREAGMKPPDLALALRQMFRQAGFELAVDTLPTDRRFYTREAIADRLGILSEASGEPYATAISAILQKIVIDEDEKRLVRFENNGHPGEDTQFAESVIKKVDHWLKENGYPAEISFIDKKGRTTKRHAKYRQ